MVCVSLARRKGLGRLICDLCEELVQIHWNKNIMYLHVEQDNMAAQVRRVYICMLFHDSISHDRTQRLNNSFQHVPPAQSAHFPHYHTHLLIYIPTTNNITCNSYLIK